ncbi:hypothetical protein [Frankia sp. R82]|uniref:hypothetical protein n=1 Tax=Frankia sp. R82 TaxID=2950553 RepID=UPI002042E5AF|nr:hypothetical protein [Frankia sp. R82]MCM3884026.1 hypothetical protein [Frankia sp. R82]
MPLSGARPRGPKAELENKSQLALLHHLHELNQPYRVSYEMVVRKVWVDDEDARIRRSRARDLSRQFRGDKDIDWHVIENYLELLFPDDHDELHAQLTHARPLFVAAFGPDAADEAGPDDGSATAPSPEYVAELERQLAESRMRASLATALLVIVRSENAALRGRNVSFGWFDATPGADDHAPHDRDGDERATLRDRVTPSGRTSRSGQASPGGQAARAGRAAAERPTSGNGASHDPATAPIARPPARRNVHRQRRGTAGPARPTPIAGRLYPSAAPSLAAAVAAAVAAARSAPSASSPAASTTPATAASARPATGRTVAARSAATRTTSNRAANSPAAGLQPVGVQPAGGQTSGLQTTGVQVMGKQRTGNRITGSRTADGEPDILAAGPPRRRRGR